MNTKKIVVLGMLVALTGAQCWGAAAPAVQSWHKSVRDAIKQLDTDAVQILLDARAFTDALNNSKNIKDLAWALLEGDSIYQKKLSLISLDKEYRLDRKAIKELGIKKEKMEQLLINEIANKPYIGDIDKRNEAIFHLLTVAARDNHIILIQNLLENLPSLDTNQIKKALKSIIFDIDIVIAMDRPFSFEEMPQLFVNEIAKRCHGGNIIEYLNTPDSNSVKTLLQQAISNNNRYAVEFLLKNGANIELPNILGDTALIQATSQASPNIVRMLLDAGADKNKQNADGISALDMSRLNLVKEMRIKIGKVNPKCRENDISINDLLERWETPGLSL